MSGLATEWALWMLPVAWQVTLLATAVLVLDLLLRRVLWPQLLHGLWLLVPLCALLPPIESPLSAGGSLTAPASPPVGWFVAWAAGVVLFGALALRRRGRARRALRGGAIEDPAFPRAARRLGLRRPVALFRSPALASPVVFGIFRPKVGMPDVPMSAREREHVYLHELAHVKRGDLLVQALFGAVHLLLWFHPLVLLARHRAHGLREVCCDARVAAVLRDGTPAYRDTLLRFAERLLPPVGAAGFLGGPAVILMRLRWLDRGEWVQTRGRRLATAAAILAMAVLLVPRAQAGVIDPALSSLRAELARRAKHLAENYESEGCLELQWTVRRLMQLEREEKETR